MTSLDELFMVNFWLLIVILWLCKISIIINAVAFFTNLQVLRQVLIQSWKKLFSVGLLSRNLIKIIPKFGTQLIMEVYKQKQGIILSHKTSFRESGKINLVKTF